MILDLDDFCESNTSLKELQELKAQIPALKVNLFTIPGRCSLHFIREMMDIEWIDMLPHGFMHTTSRECQHWTYKQADTYLKWLRQFSMTKCFKAPGWQLSDAVYAVLVEHGYAIADQTYNNERRPKRMQTYLLDSPDKIHGHIGHLGGHNDNELSLITDVILAHKDKEFTFIKDTFANDTITKS